MLAYLTAKPAGGSLICLVLAVAMFVLAVIDASVPPRARAWWPALVAAGAAFFVFAFLIK